MLDSLEIKNFRNLKELQITSLGKVNLIVGKNNTGKSTILEALAIYATNRGPDILFELLEERREYSRSEKNRMTGEKNNIEEYNVQALSSLFTDRVISFDADDSVYIGNIKNKKLNYEKSEKKPVSFRFILYVKEMGKDDDGNVFHRIRKHQQLALEINTVSSSENYNIGLEINIGNHPILVDLDNDRPNRFMNVGRFVKDDYQLIRTNNIDRETNGTLFDNIALTDKEQYVINALKIIEPTSERIAFIGENRRERYAVIKLANNPRILPLRSMGDGMNRILTIILAMVNADNGFLLIDEFENGLHYTTQEQLWKVIFSLAKQLNIQVFATTHSEDCIRGFEAVLNSSGQGDGKLIRLHNDNGMIKEVEFNAEELKIATNRNIEIR